MTVQLASVLCLLAAAIVMFAMNKPRMDAVALITLTLLPFTGAVTMGEALSGFADANIVLIAALFVIGDGLVRTGVARHLGDWLIQKAGSSEIVLLVLLMAVVCGLGSMMSSTAVTAIFIPVAIRIAQSTGTSPSKLMMPLSMAALISGMTTLVATAPNLVVNAELIRHLESQGQKGATGFSFFAFTPFGVPILMLGIGYMLFARRWLPAGNITNPTSNNRPSLADWVGLYQLAAREYRLRVGESSPLVGKTLQEAELRSAFGANVIAIERARNFSHKIMRPSATVELQAGDVLLIDLFGEHGDIDNVRAKLGLEVMPLSGSYFNDRAQEIGMAEVIVPEDSPLIGKTIVEADFRTHCGVSAIGLKRGQKTLEKSLRDEKLKLGDTLLVAGPWKYITRLNPDAAGVLIMRLPSDVAEVLPVPGKAWQAVGCLALVVGLMISGIVPNVQAALIGCLLMGLLGCVDLNSSYRCIDWKTLVLIVGMLPFSTALQRTGGVDLMADGMTRMIGGAGIHVVLACVFIVTATLGLFISNTATAVLMAPVAIAIATDMKSSPYPFAMIVALAASTAFMTPVSSPVNTLVVTPGNYQFGDFVKVGTPFAVIVLIVCVTMVPWLLPP